jgi:N,N'-diacetyllegionaminate synthase
MRIGDQDISASSRALVIAEIGVNHDGQLARALQLVETAAGCGADAVKLQVFRAGALMHRSARFAEYQKGSAPDPMEMLRRYELPFEDMQKVVAYAKQKQLLAIATPFSLGDVGVVAQLGLDAVKIASPDLVNFPLLREAAATGLPMLVSTGAATIDEVDAAEDELAVFPHALLHCVSSYPTAPADANLCWIGELSRRYLVPIGYSDHTTDVYGGALAVAAGACVIEKHITHDRAAEGPDHAASSDPREFAEYVRLIRGSEVMRGGGGKRVLHAEHDVRAVSLQSLVAARNLTVGQIIAAQDLTTMRPGAGIPASRFDAIVGRRVTRAILAGTMLDYSMLTASAAA